MYRSALLLLTLTFLIGNVLLAMTGCHALKGLNRIPKQVDEKKENITGKGESTYEHPWKWIGSDPIPVENGKSFRLPPYVFIPDFELDRKMPLFRELADLRDRVYRELELSESGKIIKVYLFKTRKSFRKYIKKQFPQLPERRAFFVAQPLGHPHGEDLMVFTYWSDEIEQDLRHELTHALLHSVLKDVPQWLDEGLAEYFETTKAANGLHEHHLQRIQFVKKGTSWPDMKRLETLNKVKDMSTADYRQAWAWVHFMLRGNPKARRVLIHYLHELRTNCKPGELYPRLQAVVPNPDEALVTHIERLKKDCTSSSIATLR